MEDNPDPGTQQERRSMVSRSMSLLMAGGLAAGYGAFAAIAGRFLYPAEDPDTVWMYVRDVASFQEGSALHYTAPSGAKITVARTGSRGDVSDFQALSSVCPHLGCQVHWEPQNNRFFCPCHNGVFDPQGKATEGPPFEASQSLPQYELQVKKGLLYIKVAVEQVAVVPSWSPKLPAGPPGPGHDPCLYFASNRSRKV
jgi:Rieske Fe-S protein